MNLQGNEDASRKFEEIFAEYEADKGPIQNPKRIPQMQQQPTNSPV